MNLSIESGPRIPVRVVSDADLRENGGKYKLMGGAVLPVDGVALADLEPSRGIQSGAATAVYLVSDAQIATPRFKLGGGARIPVVTAPSDRKTESFVAIPVYDSGGAW